MKLDIWQGAMKAECYLKNTTDAETAGTTSTNASTETF